MLPWCSLAEYLDLWLRIVVLFRSSCKLPNRYMLFANTFCFGIFVNEKCGKPETIRESQQIMELNIFPQNFCFLFFVFFCISNKKFINFFYFCASFIWNLTEAIGTRQPDERSNCLQICFIHQLTKFPPTIFSLNELFPFALLTQDCCDQGP